MYIGINSVALSVVVAFAEIGIDIGAEGGHQRQCYFHRVYDLCYARFFSSGICKLTRLERVCMEIMPEAMSLDDIVHHRSTIELNGHGWARCACEKDVIVSKPKDQ